MSQLRFWDVLCATCVCRWWNALWRRWQMCYQGPTPCLSVRSVWWHWRQVTYSQMILYLLYFIGFWLYLHINILVMWIFLGAATDFFFFLNCQLICQLFYGLWNSMKSLKNTHYNFPEPKEIQSNCLLWLDHPKTQIYSSHILEYKS